MPFEDFVVCDADMHVMEPADLWQRYMTPEYRHAAPVGMTELRRDIRVKVKSQILLRAGPVNPLKERGGSGIGWGGSNATAKGGSSASGGSQASTGPRNSGGSSAAGGSSSGDSGSGLFVEQNTPIAALTDTPLDLSAAALDASAQGGS